MIPRVMDETPGLARISLRDMGDRVLNLPALETGLFRRTVEALLARLLPRAVRVREKMNVDAILGRSNAH